MSRALEKYLDHVMIYANRKPDDAAKIRLELEDHLKQKITELQAQGVVERLPVTVPSLLRSRKRISGRLPLPRSADPRVESALANPSARRLPVVVLRRPVSLPFRETARSLSRLAESRLPPAVLRLLPSVPRDRVTARESSRVLAKPCLSAVFVAARLSGRTGVSRRSRRLRSMRPSSRTRRRSRFDTL